MQYSREEKQLIYSLTNDPKYIALLLLLLLLLPILPPVMMMMTLGWVAKGISKTIPLCTVPLYSSESSSSSSSSSLWLARKAIFIDSLSLFSPWRSNWRRQQWDETYIQKRIGTFWFLFWLSHKFIITTTSPMRSWAGREAGREGGLEGVKKNKRNRLENVFYTRNKKGGGGEFFSCCLLWCSCIQTISSSRTPFFCMSRWNVHWCLTMT